MCNLTPRVIRTHVRLVINYVDANVRKRVPWGMLSASASDSANTTITRATWGRLSTATDRRGHLECLRRNPIRCGREKPNILSGQSAFVGLSCIPLCDLEENKISFCANQFFLTFQPSPTESSPGSEDFCRSLDFTFTNIIRIHICGSGNLLRKVYTVIVPNCVSKFIWPA